jgi:lysophospholipase L1-like esterase
MIYKIVFIFFIFLNCQYQDKQKNQNIKLISKQQKIIQKDTFKLPNLYSNNIKEIFKQKKVKIICYGNSITNGYKVNSYSVVQNPFPLVLEKLLRQNYQNDSIKVIKEGKNGRRADQALKDLDLKVLSQKPQLVIIEFGINDAYSGFKSDFFNAQMMKMIEIIEKNNIKILVASPTPILTIQNKQVWELTTELYQLCKKKNIPFVNLYEAVQDKAKQNKIELKKILPDNIHFEDEYYAWLADFIFQYIQK